MPKRKITKRVVDGLPAKTGSYITDSEVPGYFIRRLNSGRVQYGIRYRMGERRCRMVFGLHGDGTTPITARRQAEAARGLIAEGRNPLDARRGNRAEAVKAQEERAQATARTTRAVGEAWKAYQQRRVDKGRLKQRSLDESWRLWERHVLPRCGSRPFPEITRPEVVALHDALSVHTPAVADRVVALLSQVAIWASDVHGIDCRNPAAKIEKIEREVERSTFDDRQLAALGKALRKVEMPNTTRALIRLTALTGLRPGEVKRLRWEDVDKEAGVLLIALAKTGTRRHPLCKRALDTIEGLERGEGAYLFPSRRDPSLPVTEYRKPWAAVLKAAKIEHCSPYTLRRAYGRQSELASHSIICTKALLGHSTRDLGSLDSYRRAVDPLVKAAAEELGDRIAGLLDGTIAPTGVAS